MYKTQWVPFVECRLTNPWTLKTCNRAYEAKMVNLVNWEFPFKYLVAFFLTSFKSHITPDYSVVKNIWVTNMRHKFLSSTENLRIEKVLGQYKKWKNWKLVLQYTSPDRKFCYTWKLSSVLNELKENVFPMKSYIPFPASGDSRAGTASTFFDF